MSSGRVSGLQLAQSLEVRLHSGCSSIFGRSYIDSRTVWSEGILHRTLELLINSYVAMDRNTEDILVLPCMYA